MKLNMKRKLSLKFFFPLFEQNKKQLVLIKHLPFSFRLSSWSQVEFPQLERARVPFTGGMQTHSGLSVSGHNPFTFTAASSERALATTLTTVITGQTHTRDTGKGKGCSIQRFKGNNPTNIGYPSEGLELAFQQRNWELRGSTTEKRVQNKASTDFWTSP